MKMKIRGLVKKVLSAIPGASEPETLEEAQETIETNLGYRKTLASLSYGAGALAIGVGVFALLTKAGVIFAATGIALAGYGLVRGAMHVLDRDIRNNRVAELRFLAAGLGEDENAPAAKPLPDKDLGEAFKDPAQAQRIRELEKQLAELEAQAAAQRKPKISAPGAPS